MTRPASTHSRIATFACALLLLVSLGCGKGGGGGDESRDDDGGPTNRWDEMRWDIDPWAHNPLNQEHDSLLVVRFRDSSPTGRHG